MPITHKGEVDRNQTARSELEQISSKLTLPDNIKENAMQLYHECVEHDILRGNRTIQAVMAAAIYASCRRAELPITFNDVIRSCCVRFNIDVFAVYQDMVSTLDLNIPLDNPEKYVPRYVSALGLSAGVEEKALQLLREAKQRELISSGSNPVGASAAAIYLAAKLAGENRSANKVLKATGVQGPTLQKRYKELLRLVDTDTDL